MFVVYFFFKSKNTIQLYVKLIKIEFKYALILHVYTDIQVLLLYHMKS